MPERSLAEIMSIDANIQAMGLDDLHDLTTRAFQESSEQMGVFCLAEAIDSVLMWSHYADDHKGIALRFNFPLSDKGGLFPLFSVRYQEERPTINAYFGGTDQSNDIMDALCTKAPAWSYEKEWRVLEPGGAASIVEFDPKIITGVVMGARVLDTDAFWLLDQCIKRGIPLMKAMPDIQTFRIVFREAYDPRTA